MLHILLWHFINLIKFCICIITCISFKSWSSFNELLSGFFLYSSVGRTFIIDVIHQHTPCGTFVDALDKGWNKQKVNKYLHALHNCIMKYMQQLHLDLVQGFSTATTAMRCQCLRRKIQEVSAGLISQEWYLMTWPHHAAIEYSIFRNLELTPPRLVEPIIQ